MFKIVFVFFILLSSSSVSAEVFKCLDGDRTSYSNVPCVASREEMNASVTISSMAPSKESECQFYRRQLQTIDAALSGSPSMKDRWETRRAETVERLTGCDQEAGEAVGGKKLVVGIEKTATQ